MKCPDTGTIQAYIDGELDIKIKKDLESHIQGCEECRNSLGQLKSNDDFVFEKLTNYRNYYEDSPVEPDKSFKPVTEGNMELKQKKGLLHLMRKYNKIIAAACALVILSTCITVQPARAVILNALSIFRVDNLKGIRITAQELTQIKEFLSNGQGEFNLDNIGKISLKGGKSTPATLDEIKSTCGFPMLAPTGLAGIKPAVEKFEPMTASFTLNVKSTNAILKSVNASRLFPDGVDGKTFTARFGAQAQARYIVDGKSYTLVGTTSPQFEVPDGVDADQLFSTVVDLPVFPEELKFKLKSISDWRNTLYIPVIDPMQEISINGIKAYICSNERKDGGSHSVTSHAIWMNNGLVYGATSNTGKDDLIRFIESLK